MNKKLINCNKIVTIIILTAVLALSQCIVFAEEPASWAKQEITDAINNGIVPNTLLHSYTENITRLEAVELLMKSMRVHFGLSNAEIVEKFNKSDVWVEFSDTDDEDVIAASKLGIVAGVSINLFAPDTPVTREQFAVFLNRKNTYIGVKPNVSPLSYSDRDSLSPWAIDAVSTVSSLIDDEGQRVMMGSENLFDPNGNITRQQSIAVVNRFFNLAKSINVSVSRESTEAFIDMGEYFISEGFVTNEEYQNLIDGGTVLEDGHLPIKTITLFDAMNYCNKLSKKNGLQPYYSISDITQNDQGSIESAKVETVEEAGGYRLLDGFNIDELSATGFKVIRPTVTVSAASAASDTDNKEEVKVVYVKTGGTTIIRDVEIVAPPARVEIDEVFVRGTGEDGPVELGATYELYELISSESDEEILKKYVPSLGFQTSPIDGDKKYSAEISSFYMGRYPVTQGEFEKVMGYNPSFNRGSGRERYPVEKVTFFEAVDFCNILSEINGLEKVYTVRPIDIVHWGTPSDENLANNFICECDLGEKCDYEKGFPGIVDVIVHTDYTKNGYRLPTEAEWEYAARGGENRDPYFYSGSDDLDEVAWHREYTNPFTNITFADNAGNTTHPVGMKAPNSLGIYDMTGNVTEWCTTRTGSNPIGMFYDPTSVAAGPKQFDVRYGIRGGAFTGVNDSQMEIFYRYSRSGAVVLQSSGLRVVRSVVENHMNDMALVEGGNITMNTDDNRLATLPRRSKSEPEVVKDGDTVTLNNYYMSRTEVTQNEFEAFMGYNPSQFINEYAPVENVTWYDAIAFCNEKSIAHGFAPYYNLEVISQNENSIISANVTIFDEDAPGFRLPTEEEWLFAARGGVISTGNLTIVSEPYVRMEFPYAGGTNQKEVSWNPENAEGTTHQVGLKKANEFGLFDMSGNVAEWCYNSDEEGKVVYGGSWNSDVKIANTSDKVPESRKTFNGSTASGEIGFRVVFTGKRS